jgi:hypothetical protein
MFILSLTGEEPGFFAAAALNDTRKSHDESTYASEHFLVSFRVESAERRIPVPV